MLYVTSEVFQTAPGPGVMVKVVATKLLADPNTKYDIILPFWNLKYIDTELTSDVS